MNYEELVKALRILQDKNSLSYYKRQVCKDAAAAIEALQAQLPELGEWIRVEDGESYHYKCSECGERPLYSRYGDVVLSGVCPMCGAKMEVQE